MKQKVLEKLEWRTLITELAASCRTAAGRENCLALSPTQTRPQIEERWALVDPLRRLVAMGYTPPLSELHDLTAIMRAVEVGQTLNGLDLRQIYDLLTNVKNVHKFCLDFSSKCQTLRLFHARTYPLPRILAEIEKTVGLDGELLDDASPELKAIRQSKLSLRKKIESIIRNLFQDAELLKYLQDDFFTIRAERYVVPMKLDGRGRIKGSIYDTSDSGQTLFMEPSIIAPLNEELLELDLSEKLEILRIFRDLGEKIKTELEIIRQNYEELVRLDTLTAEAVLAHRLNANPVRLTDTPGLQLKAARHPLLTLDRQGAVVANDIDLESDQRVLVISGPNAGGKTVVLKTVGILHLMAKSGLLVSADTASEMYLFNEVHLELGDAQNLTANLSTFSGHMYGLKPIVAGASAHDLALLDEIAAGTEPQAGSALAQSILEHLADRKVHTIATTHFDSLKNLAVENGLFRNGSMEYSMKTLKPTYSLFLDVPGQSYGIEVAEQIGLPPGVIARAKSLRGSHATRMDEIIADLNKTRSELRHKTQSVEAKSLEVEAAKAHWERERDALTEARRTATHTVSSRLQEQLDELRQEYDEVVTTLRSRIKELESTDRLDQREREEFTELRHRAEQSLGKMRGTLADAHAASESRDDRPIPTFEQLKPKLTVFVKSLGKEGTVTRVGNHEDQPVDVRIGLMTVQVPRQDLRLLEAPKPEKPARSKSGKQQTPAPAAPKSKEIPYTPQTSANTVDLRGLDIDDAINQMWRFVDQCLLSGQGRIVIIHGHGMNKLKPALREALSKSSPYKLNFRAGEDGEGGDGVTIVMFSA